ncbi:DUF3488 and transglutaminase-like domain-containing protein [Nocardioides sp.]|uniref:DUF3488 and transglutaminase-like domain-containing protein n=1 Tax=Nocardioides sp. TaxID=35761 RepID=UPI002B7A10F0|nr:DUF3488 and transglutaminase-like domain-containing protein [Nocardioides sp.]HXH79864.1 DUF3488 and transglutaminase-like domain-containing protein [Nocardioides sp.]
MTTQLTQARPPAQGLPVANPVANPVAAPGPSLAVGVWAAALLVIGSLSLATAWSGWVPALALTVAAVLPLLIVRLVLRAGISPWAGAGVVVLLLLLLSYLMAARAETSFADTVRDAVPRLLTTPRPYPVRADLLVAPLTLTGLVSVLVALRLASSHRVAPVLGASTLYVAGALLTVGAGDRWGVVAALMLAASVLGWVLLDEHREPTSHRIAVAAPLAVAGLGIVVAASLLPAGSPFQPRDVVDPPVVTVVASSPMPQLGAWQASPDEPLFEVSGPAVPLRLVTLDSYDGTHWTAPTSYAPLGSTDAERVLPGGLRTRTVSLRVHLTELGGNWLPTPGWPTAISESRAVVDNDTGTAFLATAEAIDPAMGADPTDPDSSPTDDLTYDVTGRVDVPLPEALTTAAVPAPETVSRYVSLPPLPEKLAQFADGAAAGAATPYERAKVLEKLVKESAQLSAKAISGSQIWRIESFLYGKRGTDAGARMGTSEQFATAYALLARYHGLPTRVVVGFRPGDEQPDGTRIVRGGDAFAWPEVYFQDLGWVAFSPTPDDDTFRRDVPQESRAPDDGADDEMNPDDSAASGDSEDGAVAGSTAESTLTWQVLVAGAGGLALLTGLVLAAARALRRRRHRRRGASGAWAEVLDALHLAGDAPPRHWSASQVAAATDARLAITSTAPIAVHAERAAFSPDPADGAASWDADLVTLRKSVRRTLPVWRRWWWSLDPRVFARR